MPKNPILDLIATALADSDLSVDAMRWTPAEDSPAALAVTVQYRICIVRKGQPAERRICTSGGELRDAVYGLVREQGATITDDGHASLIALVGDARSLADIEGFAALEFGTSAITVRPHDA